MRVSIPNKLASSFKGQSVISIKDFKREQIDYLLDLSLEIEEELNKDKKLNKFSRSLEGMLLASCFFEPSTRTRLSFEAAMKKLGGDVIGFSSEEGTSTEKGENLTDTLKTIESYFVDAVVLRHKKEGSCVYAKEFLKVPVINAGCGAQEHPTQAFLDLYTILKKKKTIDGLTIALCGDLKYGRTVHSLSYALALYNIKKLMLVSPPELKMREEVSKYLEGKMEIVEGSDMERLLPEADVIYMTRIQRERFPDEREYLKVKGSYKLTKEMLDKCKKDAIILHPLPKIDEIASEVDKDPRAAYFEQTKNGMIVRMALLYLILA